MVTVWRKNPVFRLAGAIAVAGLAVPVILAWSMFGRAPTVSASEGKRLLRDGSTLLVTVDASLSARIPESKVWPLESIMQMRNASQMPDNMRNKTLLLICPGGIRSARAALHLRRIGVGRAFSVRGGLQEWITQSSAGLVGSNIRRSPDAAASAPFFQPAPLHEQWAAVLTFFGIKSIYSILAAMLAIIVWRETAADLAALRRSMLAFFIGEGFCFVNVVALGDHSFLFEHLHSAGMVVSVTFFVYGLLEGLDSRLIHFSDEVRCAAIGLCGICFKHSQVPCGLRRTFLFSVPLLGLTAALPLFSPLRDTAYNTLILGTIYGYRHPVIHQIYELRYLPAAAVVLLTFCFLVLLLVENRKVQLSKVLFSAALGAMTFSFFRLLLVATFVEHQVWFAAWEEVSELIYVLLAGSVLFLFPRISPSVGHIIQMSAGRSRS